MLAVLVLFVRTVLIQYKKDGRIKPTFVFQDTQNKTCVHGNVGCLSDKIVKAKIVPKRQLITLPNNFK